MPTTARNRGAGRTVRPAPPATYPQHITVTVVRVNTIIIANLIGLAASLASSLQHPSHVVYLWGHKDEPPVLRGLSLASILFTTANSVMWAIYGVLYNAWPTTIAAAAALVVMAITAWLLVRARVWTPLGTAAFLAFTTVCTWWSFWVSQDTLGLWGNILSIVMWIPAAMRVVRRRGTVAALAYPPLMSWIIVATNVAWIVYGVMLDDIWLWLSSPVSIVCAGIMLWSYHSTARVLGTQPEVPEDEPVPAK